MPWYRGRTLASNTPLDRADARRVFERCAYGLSAMHDAGICHYDIKPDNTFVCACRRRPERPEGVRAAIGDLGLSSLAHARSASDVGRSIFSPLFRPPEVLMGLSGSTRAATFSFWNPTTTQTFVTPASARRSS